MENVLESAQCILCVEYFAHPLFEDITLDSQMDEFAIWEDRMAEAGLVTRFLAVLKGTLKKRTDQMRKAANVDDPLIEFLETYLDGSTDRRCGPFRRRAE